MTKTDSPCRWLTASTEAYRVNPDRSLTRIPGPMLCGWADGHRDEIAIMPPWARGWIEAGGPNFSPDRHCPGCPGHEPYDFTAELGATHGS